MRTSLQLAFALLVATGCARLSGVDFVWFNVSGHEITVTGISGLPAFSTPSVLVPVPNDTNRLNEASATCWDSVKVGDSIKFVWSEGGVSRQFEAKRVELGIPSRLNGGQVRFTYIGEGKWRIRFVHGKL